MSDSPFEALVGQELDTVSFVRDYVELRIDYSIVRLLTDPTRSIDGDVWRLTDTSGVVIKPGAVQRCHVAPLHRARFIERPVPWQTALITVLAFSLIFVTLAEGHYLAAVLVLAAAVGLDLAARVVYNRRPGRTALLQESTLLPYSPETVWALIMPPEKAPLVDANCRRGYREAGSPDGVGERHVLEALDGQTTTLEVIELEPARRAVVRLVSPAPKQDTRLSCTLQPMEEGCLYSMGFEIDLLRGQHVLQRFKDGWHSDVQAMFGRIRQVLADAERDRTVIVRD